MEGKETQAPNRLFSNKLLLIDVRTRLNPDNQNLVGADTLDQGKHVAKLMRRAFLQLNLQVQLDFTNVIRITPDFLKGVLGDLAKTYAGNHLLSRIKFSGCGNMIDAMWNTIVAHSRVEHVALGCRSFEQR